MEVSVRDEYLTTQVLTATPQKLHLMLIEAAVRSAEQASRQWQEGDPGAAGEALVHAQDCAGQLLAGLDHEGGPDVVRKLAALYVFVFRRLVHANLHRDAKALDDALRILRMERDTWRQVCARPEAPDAGPPADGRFSIQA